MGTRVMKAADFTEIFRLCIDAYHVHDHVDQAMENPFEEGAIKYLAYQKCWIDTVQWHYEDLIRDPQIDPEEGMALKRKIDASNQHRTDIVERIDDYFLEIFANHSPDAKLNTESPAWVVDRLSILALKIYHMREQATRPDAASDLLEKSKARLAILEEQEQDLSASFDQLIEDYRTGARRMKVYRQMKLYNDPETNPVLYKK